MSFQVTPALFQTSLGFFWSLYSIQREWSREIFLHECFCDYIGAMLTSAPSNLQILHGGIGPDDL